MLTKAAAAHLAIQRWVDAGGRWEVLSRGEQTAKVALLSCTGEQMQQITVPVSVVDDRA